jgi:hypothetical protein
VARSLPERWPAVRLWGPATLAVQGHAPPLGKAAGAINRTGRRSVERYRAEPLAIASTVIRITIPIPIAAGWNVPQMKITDGERRSPAVGGGKVINQPELEAILERRPELKGKSLEAVKRILRRERRLSLRPRRTWTKTI